jgi:hypothetical protein
MIIVCLIKKTTMANTLKSQIRNTSVHEFSLSLAGSVTGFRYKFDAGSLSLGLGGGIEAGYIYNFNERFGLNVGLGLSIYSNKMNLNDDFSEQYSTIDENGDEFDFTYSLAGYNEKQLATMLYIPLMARYIVPIGSGQLKYVVAGGVKIQFPVTTSVHAIINTGAINSSGYYSYEGRTYTNLPHHGFVTDMSVSKFHKNIDLNVVPVLSLESGIRFLSGDNNIDLRVYLDYSLTNIRKSGDGHIVEYQSSNPSQFKYHSVVNTGLVDKVSIFGTGVKIGVGF